MNWKIKELAGKYCYKNTLHAIKKNQYFYAKKEKKRTERPTHPGPPSKAGAKPDRPGNAHKIGRPQHPPCSFALFL